MTDLVRGLDQKRGYGQMKKKKMPLILMGILILFVLTIVVAGGLIWSKLSLLQFDTGASSPAGHDVLDVQAFHESEPAVQEEQLQGLQEEATEPRIPQTSMKQEKNVLNILLIGTDERTKKFSKKARSDSMILVSVNINAKTVKLVSLERGMGVPVLAGPHKGEWDWLTHIFAYGGADLLMQTIEECFRVEVDRYIRVNFNTVTTAIDAIGGIEMDLSAAEAKFYTSELNNPKKTGMNHLNGEETLMFARLRAIDSDWQRVERQRKVILAVKEKLKNVGLSELNQLSNQVLPLIQTNMTKTELLELILYCPDFIRSTFTQMTLPKHGTYGFRTGMEGREYFAADFDENSRILKEFLYGATD